MKFSRLLRTVQAKQEHISVSDMVDQLQKLQVAIKHNPIGFDQMSYEGFDHVIQNLQANASVIENGPPDPNAIWGILEAYAPFFTTAEYMMLLTLAHRVVDLED